MTGLVVEAEFVMNQEEIHLSPVKRLTTVNFVVISTYHLSSGVWPSVTLFSEVLGEAKCNASSGDSRLRRKEWQW